MDVAGSAVGIASLGIQVCQGLLSYYDAWRGYHDSIGGTYDSIDDLSKTLMQLKSSLERNALDKENTIRVKRCLESCEDALVKLSSKLKKLREYDEPEGLRQKAWSQVQRLWYPLREKTLTKLRDTVVDIQERLKLALSVLQLDVSTGSQKLLVSLEGQITEIYTNVAHITSQNQRLLAVQDADEFRKIVEWLSPADPWTNHDSAYKKHGRQTGGWILQSPQYQSWKAGSVSHLWMCGKAGCGKTVLFSTVVNDMRSQEQSGTNSALAVFYFSFSDDRKKSYTDLLRSLVAQLGWKEPGLSMLRQEHRKPYRSTLGVDELEKILLSSMESFNQVYVLVDALDECPKDSDVRQNVLEGVERLTQHTPGLKVFATSNEVLDIRESMKRLKAEQLPVIAHAVNADIQQYVSNELARDRRLHRLDAKIRTLIQDTITQKADGMFRWAFCQLQELKRLESTKPKYVREALLALPETLDATYSRTLLNIPKMFRAEALALLRWLVYARSPPTLRELSEASIIDPKAETSVDVENRGDLASTLNILSDLVTGEGSETADVHSNPQNGDSMSEGSHDEHTAWDINGDTRIRLAHFSVQEYLESTRILDGDAKSFYLESAEGHQFLADSCLAYILHYSGDSGKMSSTQDLVSFPLLDYAACSWYYHVSFQQHGEINRMVLLLASEEAKRDWLLVHQPDKPWSKAFSIYDDLGSGLYYASYLGLKAVVEEFLDNESDINAQGGRYGTALQAASARGHEEVVKLLLAKGVDVNAQGGYYGTALQAASARGHEEVVKLLLAEGVDVNAQEGPYGTALQAASARGYEEVVKLLLAKGADVNARGGVYNTALQLASAEGHGEVVKLLFAKGVDIDAQGGFYGTALQAASAEGHEEVVKLLLAKGVDVNAQGGRFGTALQAASAGGHEEVVKLLLAKGADVNARGGGYGTALQAASDRGHKEVVKLLLAKGVDVNAQGGRFGTALQAASAGGHEEVVKLLLAKGADVNAQGGKFGNALQAASDGGHEQTVKLLLDRGANLKTRPPPQLTGSGRDGEMAHPSIAVESPNRRADDAHSSVPPKPK